MGHRKHGHWKAYDHGHADGSVVIEVHGGGQMNITGSSHGNGKHRGGKPGKGGKGKWK